MRWLMITYHDDEVRQQARRVLARALGPAAPQILLAANLAQAQQLLADHGEAQCALLVIGAATPVDGRSSVGQSDREPTRALLDALRQRQPDLPVLLLSTTPDDVLAEFLYAFRHWALVSINAGFAANLPARARELMAAAAPTPLPAPGAWAAPRDGSGTRRACLQLDIELCDERSATYHLRRIGADGFEKPGVLVLDKREIDDILRESRRLEADVAERRTSWLSDLDHLSGRLSRLLFQGGEENFRCWERFLRHREQVGGIANTRVRLTVDDRTHPMLVEALRDQAESTDAYWMLSAPVFRRYRPRGKDMAPLFKDPVSRGAPINCLVIEADGQAGNVPLGDGSTPEFDRLDHCRKEALAVSKLLRSTAGGMVRRLALGQVRGDVQQHVLDVLRAGHWHIVHFCGHAFGSGAGDTGLVLRADRNGILPVTRLVEALDNTQLLFLSSCRSASADIVTCAVEKGVPAVVGFRWMIDDAAASRFAAEFYRRLFDPDDSDCYRYVEYAFTKARKAAHDGQAGPAAANDRRWQAAAASPRQPDPSWVAPMLVMQLG